jgi:Sulfotransferase family
MPAPSFLCVGMPKCGTSTLYDVLRHQSEIFVPPVKEIKFLASSKIRYSGSPYQLLFSRHWAARQDRLALMRVIKKVALNRGHPEDLIWSLKFGFSKRDLEWYYSLFPEDHISGDVSPIYHILRRDEIAEIASAMPDLKIMILLRSPLQQIWSHCRMVIVGLQKQERADAFRRHIETLSRERRTYLSLIDDWSSHFVGQIFVGYLDDMAKDPARFFSEVFRFWALRKQNARLPAIRRVWAQDRMRAFRTMFPRMSGRPLLITRPCAWRGSMRSPRSAPPDGGANWKRSGVASPSWMASQIARRTSTPPGLARPRHQARRDITAWHESRGAGRRGCSSCAAGKVGRSKSIDYARAGMAREPELSTRWDGSSRRPRSSRESAGRSSVTSFRCSTGRA